MNTKTLVQAGTRFNPSMTFSRYAPQVVFEAENGSGTGDPETKTPETKVPETKTPETKVPETKTPETKVPEQKKPTEEEAALLRENMRRKAQNVELSKELEAFKSLGLKPDELQAIVQQRKDAEKAELEKRGEFDRVKEMMAEENKKAVDAIAAQIAAKDAEIAKRDSVINELTIGTSFNGSKFITEELVLTPSKARALYGSHFDVVDGSVVAYDKPRGAADRTPLVDAKGNNIGFEAAIAKLVEADPDRDSLLKSKMKIGAGSGSDPVRRQATNTKPELKGVGRIAAGLSQKGKGVKS